MIYITYKPYSQYIIFWDDAHSIIPTKISVVSTVPKRVTVRRVAPELPSGVKKQAPKGRALCRQPMSVSVNQGPSHKIDGGLY